MKISGCPIQKDPREQAIYKRIDLLSNVDINSILEIRILFLNQVVRHLNMLQGFSAFAKNNTVCERTLLGS